MLENVVLNHNFNTCDYICSFIYNLLSVILDKFRLNYKTIAEKLMNLVYEKSVRVSLDLQQGCLTKHLRIQRT